MSTCADVGSFIGSKSSVVQTSNVGFTSEVSDYLVVHTGPGAAVIGKDQVLLQPRLLHSENEVYTKNGIIDSVLLLLFLFLFCLLLGFFLGVVVVVVLFCFGGGGEEGFIIILFTK